jgi:hypothetical protein
MAYLTWNPEKPSTGFKSQKKKKKTYLNRNRFSEKFFPPKTRCISEIDVISEESAHGR